MTELTTQQIGARLQREDATAAEYQTLVGAITARRRVIKARLDEIENRNGAARRAAMASCDPAQIALLNREAETLDDETGFLCDLESRAYQLHVRAIERETIENARLGRKKLPALIDAASKALAKYRDARQQLEDAIGAMGGARNLLRAEPAAAKSMEVGDAELAQLVAALFVDPPTAGAVAGLRQRICAPPPPIYSDGPPDLAAQVRDVMSSPFAGRDRGP